MTIERKHEIALSIAATILVAGTRVLALARTPWDWDEMLFLLGLADYDVSLHHPHPPGFPLFLLAARGLMSFGIEPFRALQLINLVAAIAIVPAFLFLGRELRLSFTVSLSASLLFAFFPNIWFFGGTGFSDVAAIVIAIAGCALLLRGARSPAAFLVGAAVIAVAIGFRPQNLLVGAVPAAMAAWAQWKQRRYGVVAAGFVLAVGITAASYAGAVLATGDWPRYRDAALAHQRYLSEVDSFLSDVRPPLVQVADDFFIRPFRFAPMNVALVLFAVVSLAVSAIRLRVSILLAVAMFGPFWILAWLTLDFHSAGRFSIGYMPLLAILCADGVAVVLRRERLVIVASAVLALVMAGWAWPGVAVAHREASPPLQAIAYVQEMFPRSTTVFVPKRLRPYAEYYLADFNLVHLEEESGTARGGVLLREGRSSAPGARTFAWPREPLWNIARRRYFEISVIPR